MSLYKCYVCDNGTYKVAEDPDYEICAKCLPFVHHATLGASIRALCESRDNLYRMPHRDKSGRTMRILACHSIDALTSVINQVIGEITHLTNVLGADTYCIQPYVPPQAATDYWDATDYYAEGYNIYEYNMPINIRKRVDTSTLAHLATTACAHLGRLEGLTDDAIDRILAIETLLAVRFLFHALFFPKIESTL